MANQGQFELLRQGVDVWNRWRMENPNISPDLRNIDLRSIDLSGVDLSRANLSRAILGRTDLSKADLSKADLSRASLTQAILSEADLSNAFLRGAFLSEANLRRACLSRADLSETDLTEADLSKADLSEANIDGADLSGADCNEARLNLADLTEANISRTDLSGATLSRADLDEALVGWTIFGNNDLSDVKGLSTVKHRGPSTIGVDTLYKSHGNIPEVFLRGCGVPENFITYIPSLVCQAIQYYSCFISYSSKDQVFAERLHADLQSKGVRCWFAPHDMRIGDRFRSRIDESIRVHEKLLLILSENSVASDWVEKEVETAMEKERESKKPVLFPVRLDDSVNAVKVGWAADVRRTRHIGDFSQWKNHDEYEGVFERLLRDLKIESSEGEA